MTAISYSRPSGREIYEQVHVLCVYLYVCVRDLENAAPGRRSMVCDAIIFTEELHLLLLLK